VSHLERLVQESRAELSIRQAKTPLEKVRERALLAAAPRPFVAKLLGGSGLIAEVKRASPSKGAINPGLDPVALARAYQMGGAACLSVLTQKTSFGGSLWDLAAARGACSLPVLRKDFLVEPYQLYEARAHGADAVLLIAAALPVDELLKLRTLAAELRLAVLFEIHEESELEAARACKPDLLGINARNLKTLEVDPDAFRRLARQAGMIAPLVAESGVKTADDVRRLRGLGARAVLVGEALSAALDPELATRVLVSA
jgi:indole-3-glycerol phosphate synthase